MAIDLQNPQNIATGWGPPPKFDAPNISGVLGDILQQRRYQQALQQKQISDAVKEIQSQRQDSAYAEALRNAGLTQGQDISGLGSKQATALAQLIAQQTPDTQRDALIQAQIAHLNRLPGGGGGGAVDAGGPEIVEKDGIKYEVIRTSKSVTYRRLPGQFGPTRTEQENAAPSTTGLTVYPDQTAAPLAPDAAPQPSPAETGGGASTDINRIRAEAQDAIDRGADPEAVKRRFHDQTGGVL